MIKIFDSTATSFNSNGKVVIKPTTFIEHKLKSLNGWYIEIEVPIEYNVFIKKDNICLIKSKSKLNPQAFRIGQPEKNSEFIKFKAEHVMFDTKKYFLDDVRVVDKNGINALTWINERTHKKSPFSFSSDVDKIATAYFEYKNLFEALQVIEERWDATFDADNWNITFSNNLGKKVGEMIVYDKNNNDIYITEDWSEVCTCLYPKGSNDLKLPEKFIESDIQYAQSYVKTITFDSELEEASEEQLIEELRTTANEYLSRNKYPKVLYELDADINESYDINDTIIVKHPLVILNTKVQEYSYDHVDMKTTNLVFGNYTKDVKEKFSNIKNEIIKAIEKSNNNQELIMHQTDVINNLNRNGLLYIDDNQMMILDKLPKEDAKYVWRFGLGGVGFSEVGIEGPYKTAWTYDGKINADFIQVGCIKTNLIEGYSELILSVNNYINQYEKDITVSKSTNGNPITIEDVGSYKLNELNIEGKSERKTTKGNQLIDFSNPSYTSSNTNYSFENNIITMSSTLNDVYIYSSWNILEILRDKIGQKLNFVASNIVSNLDKLPLIQIIVKHNNGTNDSSKNLLNNNIYDSWIVPNLENISNVQLRIYATKKDYLLENTIKITEPLLYFGDLDNPPEYEEYTNGESPNIDYPQRIETVTPTINLLPQSEKDYENKTYDDSDSTIRIRTKDFIPVDYQKKYRAVIHNSDYQFVNIALYDGAKNYIDAYYAINTNILSATNVTVNFSSVPNLKYIKIVLRAKGSPDITPGEIENIKAMFYPEENENAFPRKWVPEGTYLLNKVTGINLFDGILESGSYSSANGKPSSNSNMYRNKNPIQVKSSTKYRFQNGNVGVAMNYYEYDREGNFIKYTNVGAGAYLTTTEKTRYINCSRSSSSDTIFLHEGDSLIPYEEYKENVNYINLQKEIIIPRMTKGNINTNGELDESASYRTASDFIKVESNRYYTIDNDKYNTSLVVVLYDDEKKLVSRTVTNTYNYKTSFYVPENVEYLRFCSTESSGGPENDLSANFEMYEGYEKYYELAKVNNAKDYFDNNTIIKNTEKLVLNGTEPWTVYTSFTGTNTYRIQAKIIRNSAKVARNKIMCDSMNVLYSNNDIEHITNFNTSSNNSEYLAIYINKDRLEDISTNALVLSSFKEYLAAHPITVYYELAEPVAYKFDYEPIQLFKGYNHITVDSDLFPNMTTNYLTDSKLNAEYVSKAYHQITADSIRGEIEKSIKDVNGNITEITNTFEQKIGENEANTTSKLQLLEENTEKKYITKEDSEKNLSSAINDLEIGGRNLLIGTSGTEIYEAELNALQNTSTKNFQSSNYFNENVKVGDTLTISFDYKLDISSMGTTNPYFPAQLSVYCENGTHYLKLLNAPKQSVDWTHIEKQYTIPEGKGKVTRMSLQLYFRDYIGKAYWKKPKIELGTKGTDYTPAPEDVETQITNTKTELTNTITQRIKDAKSEIELSVSGTYETKKNVSSQISTAKSEAISSANTNTTNQLKNYTNTSGMNTAINNAKDSAISTANTNTDNKLKSYYTTTQTDAKIKTSISEEKATIIQEANANIKIGGVNLATKENVVKYGSNTSIDLSNYLKNGGFTFTRTASQNGGVTIDKEFTYEIGKEYVISFYLKLTTTATTKNLRFYNGAMFENTKVYIDDVQVASLGTPSQSLNWDDEEFHKVVIYGTHKATTQASANNQHTIIQPLYNQLIAYTAEIKNLQIETGNKVTDWSLPMEDIEKSIKAGIETSVTADEGSVKLYVNNELKDYYNKNKIDAELKLKVGTNDNNQIVSMLNASADEINIEGNRFVLKADNISIDKEGNLVCSNAKLIGGTLELEDTGTEESASIKIKNKNSGGYTYYSSDGIQADLTTDTNFTQADLTTLANYINNPSTITPAVLKKYDLNGDGKLNVIDLVHIQNQLLAGITKDKPGKFILNTNSLYDNLQMLDGDGNSKISIGFRGISIANHSVITKVNSGIFNTANDEHINYVLYDNGFFEAFGEIDIGNISANSSNTRNITLPYELDDCVVTGNVTSLVNYWSWVSIGSHISGKNVLISAQNDGSGTAPRIKIGIRICGYVNSF